MKKKKGLGVHSFLTQLILISVVPVIIMGALLSAIAAKNMKDGLQQQSMNTLKATANAVRSSYTGMNLADFAINVNGHFVKGAYNITKHMDDIDGYVEGLTTEVTIFFGDTRMATTLVDQSGNRIIGTQASPEVTEAVLKNGGEYSSYNITVNDENYYGFYMPLTNPDGTIVGMVFAGQPSEEIDSFILRKTTIVAMIAVFFMAIVVLVELFVTVRISKVIGAIENMVDELAKGNLAHEASKIVVKRKDEFGLMGKSVAKLQEELRQIVGNIQTSAENVLDNGNTLERIATQTSKTANEVSSAVDDISKGAISQAEDIETATVKVNEMGELIQTIVGSISNLNKISVSMQETGETSSKTMEELSHYNDKTVEAVYKVFDNVKATDDSVKDIAAAVELITNIASQTNLLSLNASIEAARAGEAGKGFAVVASEISKLSDESNESAKKIANIIQILSRDSKTSMSLMDEVKNTLGEQETKLAATKKEFEKIIEDIEVSRENTNTIHSQAQDCDEARQTVIGIIENLSAISEENAASTEETTASMQELNETIHRAADASAALKNMAVSLEEQTKFFQL